MLPGPAVEKRGMPKFEDGAIFFLGTFQFPQLGLLIPVISEGMTVGRGNVERTQSA